jgi:hypothetical protein
METKDIFYSVGIIATAIVSIWNIINHHKINKKTAFINTVTSERVKWLDKLRNNISAFCGLTHTWTRRDKVEDSEDEVRMLEEIDKLRYLIRLQLNPKDENGKPNPDKKIEDLISKIPNLTDPSYYKQLHASLNELIITSQELLKVEWEKVKAEAKTGDLKD